MPTPSREGHGKHRILKKMAGLPKESPLVCPAFFFYGEQKMLIVMLPPRERSSGKQTKGGLSCTLAHAVTSVVKRKGCSTGVRI
jgi:hypothetical protein